MNSILSKEDYEEPQCLLNMHPGVTAIPVGRIMEKLDAYLDKKDYASAERHLNYWLGEAEAGHDSRGRLAVLNEQIGLYRKTDRQADCLRAIDSALALSASADTENTVTCATTCINAATGFKAFGRAQKALPLYEKARDIYERLLPPDDGRLGGLYNNMALTLAELGEYSRAEELYLKAADIMSLQENGALETAITYLNLADLALQKLGPEASEKITGQYLERAETLLDSPDLPRNGYYAFVCEKCAPVFGYYGYFLTERELKRRAESIYEGT